MSASVSQLITAETGLIANVFDEMPLPAFVVDRDFHIIDFNFAGARLLDRVPFALLRLRGCGRPQCIHSIETGDDADTQACRDCVGKNFVRDVLGETKACRKTGRLRLSADGKTTCMDFLITVAALDDDSERLALLILDDAAELSALLQMKSAAASPASSSPGSTGRARARGRKMGSS